MRNNYFARTKRRLGAPCGTNRLSLLTSFDLADRLTANSFKLQAMDHYTAQNFRLTETIGFLLNKARGLLTSEMDAAISAFGITAQQMGILLALDTGWASTPFEVSKLLALDTGLTTRLLDKLEAREYLERSRSAADRRVVNLSLTSTGKKVAAQLPGMARAVLNERLRQFNSNEFEQFQALLHKFIGE